MPTWDQTFTLNTGAKIPAVGLGTWQSEPNEVKEAVKIALKEGYRHIDAAAIYGNEEEVGAGIKASSVPRSEIFITSKLWNNSHEPHLVEKALDKTLKDLGTDYLDLYLMHWPIAFRSGGELIPHTEVGTVDTMPIEEVPIIHTWRAMEALLAKGKVRAIGVANFTQDKIERLLKEVKVVPAVCQNEGHPWLQQNELLEYLKGKGIHVTAYSPLGQNTYGMPRVLNDPVVTKTAKDLGITPAQVLISWAVARGTSVIPKSVHEDRIKENFQKIDLPSEQKKLLDAQDKGQRYNDPIEWGLNIFDEHTPEEIKAAQDKYAENKRSEKK